ncbi:hypothetical protein B0H34DRAFT_732997 [Crassisporium funariophilum]|nr:hypothetical protein B0H34DRAFT_732997 [Crassisporium funariophilum]
MSAPRFVLVDDTNPGIKYDGPWSAATHGSQDDVGNFGPPFLSTLHAVNTNAGLSYSFSGSKVSALGTSKVQTLNGVTDPAWECFVDGVSIGSKAPISFSENNWVLCEDNDLADGQHVITVNATVRREQTFWFDRIQYIPSAGVSLDQSIIYVDSSDSQINFGSGWSGLRGIANATSTPGTRLTFDFTGVSVAWYGLVPGDFPIGSSSAQYSIDGQAPVSFLLAGLPSQSAMEVYNQVFFQSPQLSPGQHSLVVTHQGDSGKTPLVLDYLVVQSSNVPTVGGSPPGGQGSTTPGTTGSSTTTTSGTLVNGAPTGTNTVPVDATSVATSGGSSGGTNPGASSSNSTSGGKTQVPGIVGGIVGGLALLLIVAFLLYRWRSKRRQREISSEKALPLDDPSHIISPFNDPLGPRTPVFYPQSVPSDQYSYSPVQTAHDGSKHAHMRQYPSIPNSSGSGTQTPASFPASSGPPSSAHSSQQAGSTTPLMSKAREADMAAAAYANPIPPVNGGSAQIAAPQDDSGSQRFVRHEDSGIRMPPTERNSVVELPPMYTPG